MSEADFGLDTSCTTELRTGVLVTGKRLLAEACFRRLITPRGMLVGSEDEENYGLDISQLCGRLQSEADRASIPGQIANELTKDDRVQAVDATVLATKTGPGWTYQITISVTSDVGPFELTVGVDAVSAQLLGIKET